MYMYVVIPVAMVMGTKITFIASMVVHYGISTTVLLQYGQTALFLPAREGHADIVKLLVNYGAAVDIRDKVGNNLVTCMRSVGVDSSP